MRDEEDTVSISRHRLSDNRILRAREEAVRHEKWKAQYDAKQEQLKADGWKHWLVVGYSLIGQISFAEMKQINAYLTGRETVDLPGMQVVNHHQVVYKGYSFEIGEQSYVRLTKV